MPEVREIKKALRKSCRARAAALPAEDRAAADRAIRDAVRASSEWRRAGRVFLYVSMWAEPDTRALLADALEEGKAVFVPRCGPERTMKAVRIRDLSELRPGTLGIPEPPDGGESAAPGSLELALVPCVSVSRTGERLGHGAGYYDRFLAACRCPALCLCYEALVTEEIPHEANDVRMDALVTEKGLVRCAGSAFRG